MKSSGYSLVETLVGIFLAIGGAFLAKDQLLTVLRLNDLIKDRNYLQSLEDDLRLAILDDRTFAANTSSDPVLRNCTQTDSKDCPKEAEVKLVNARGKQVSGGFAGPSKTCKNDSCPIQIKVVVSTACAWVEGEAIKTKCDMAGSFRFTYRILVDGDVYRLGYAARRLANLNLSDDNDSCPVDAQLRTEFARVIAKRHVQCIDVQRPKLKVIGIDGGLCKVGLEVLRGFNPYGVPTCAPIKWE